MRWLCLAMAAIVACAAGCNTGRTARITKVKRRGTQADRKCDQLPQCVEYLANIKRSVNRRWNPGRGQATGTVVLRMRIDAGGTPVNLKTVRTDSPELARSCRVAIGYAEPFGPLPIALSFLKDQEITVEFVYTKPGVSG